MDIRYEILIAHDSSDFIFNEQQSQSCLKEITIQYNSYVLISCILVSSDLINNSVHFCCQLTVLLSFFKWQRELRDIPDFFVIWGVKKTLKNLFISLFHNVEIDCLSVINQVHTIRNQSVIRTRHSGRHSYTIIMIVCTNNVIVIVSTIAIFLIILIFSDNIMDWIYLRVEHVTHCLAGIVHDP